jgi:hypothetical protein
MHPIPTIAHGDNVELMNVLLLLAWTADFLQICWVKEYYRGKYHCTVDLLFDWFGISCMTTDNVCFYLQNRLIQTSQTGGQWYSDTSPFSIPCT